MTIKLYDLERSGNCYKVRLLMSLLDIDYEKIAVNLARGEQKQAEFLALNPRGQVPVLVTDANKVIWDSTAILVYLARRFGGEAWLPLDSEGLAEVAQWLAFEQNESRYGVGRARAIVTKSPTVFAQTGNLAECQAIGRKALAVLELRLKDHPWLAAPRPTIADIACFPYTAMAPDGGIALDPYPAVRAWIGRVQALPRYIPLPQMPPAG